MKVAVFVLVLAFGLGSEACFYKGWSIPKINTIKYTVTASNSSKNFDVSQNVAEKKGKEFFTYMKRAAISNPALMFETKTFGDLGCYVTTINGLEENPGEKLFWAFLYRFPNGTECLHNVGVCTYIPEDGDHLVMKYASYDIFNYVNNCETGKVESHE